jgi:thioredoxin-related protein
MKRTLTLTGTALLTSVVACTKPAPPPAADVAEGMLAIGGNMLMKETQMKNVDGAMVSIRAAGKDKGTLVIFSCNHCPYVKAWEDRIVAIGNEALDKGIGTIAINSNDPANNAEDGFEAMMTRAQEKGMKFPYVVDETSAVAKAYGATKTPEVYLFDAGGKLVYHGAIDDNSESADAVKAPYLRQAIEALLAGQPVPMAETKALGCGIKFRGA